jgi:hypothetical protein
MIFIMFKMKYLINKMQCNTLSQQVWWLDGKGGCLYLRSQGIKPYKLVFVVNNGKFIKIFLCSSLK